MINDQINCATMQNNMIYVHRTKPIVILGKRHRHLAIASVSDPLIPAMDKCLWFSVKMEVCQPSCSSQLIYPDLSTL